MRESLPTSGAVRVLVAEDDEALRHAIGCALRARGFEVEDVPDGRRAVERIERSRTEPFDLVVTDLRLPGADGVEVLRTARRVAPRTAVVLMSAFGTIEGVVEAMRLGAEDFLQKPFELGRLEACIERALARDPAPRARALARDPNARAAASGPRIVGDSPALLRVLALAERVASKRSTVLVTGETGTGKELVAALIHAASPRAEAPFVRVNCAALPETLLESELFGHERGAFTGADRPRIGRFEQADGGTLFLDEVGDMSMATQAKLLRVLEDGEFVRLGATTTRHADVRLVAATHRDLEHAVRAGTFREDLYFRLHVVRLQLPALRERGDDAVTLAEHFLGELARELGRAELAFSHEARERLRHHAWPGNVRELRNRVERAALLSEGDTLDASALGFDAGPAAESPWQPQLPPSGLAWADVERAVVLEALGRTGFVQKDAAALLSISRRRLHYMIGRMGITHPSWRRNAPPGDAEPERPS